MSYNFKVFNENSNVVYDASATTWSICGIVETLKEQSGSITIPVPSYFSELKVVISSYENDIQLYSYRVHPTVTLIRGIDVAVIEYVGSIGDGITTPSSTAAKITILGR